MRMKGFEPSHSRPYTDQLTTKSLTLFVNL